MSKINGFVGAIVALALVGCGPSDAVVDETVTGEEAAVEGELLRSYPGLAEGSAEALGLLRLANEGSLAQLSSRTEANAPARTARSIIAARSGPDGVEGTADDRPFLTLTQFFAVRYVGLATVRNMLAYAQAHGYVEVLRRYQVSAQLMNGEDWPGHPAPRTTGAFELTVRGSTTVRITGRMTSTGAVNVEVPIAADGRFQSVTKLGWQDSSQVWGRFTNGALTAFGAVDAHMLPGGSYEYYWMSVSPTSFVVAEVP